MSSYKNYILIIPFSYLIYSRLKRIDILISWFFSYLFFQYLFIRCFNFEFTINEFIILFFFLINFYEIGYIHNDVITVKKEINPTIRIKNELKNFLEKNLLIIILFKIMISFILLSNLNTEKYFFLTVLSLSLFFLFYIHNYFRGKINILTFFLLNHLKNIFIPTSILSSNMDLNNFLKLNFLVFLLFTFYRTIENLSLERFKFETLYFISKNRHLFRVIYYLLIFIFLILIYFTHIFTLSDNFLYLVILILIYRLFTFLYAKKYK